MLHHCQARSVDDIYLEDIIHIIHPETAARFLADTALPNRNIPVWDLPQGYNAFVNQYNAFHYQHPWMAYSDALADIKAGQVVLLRKNITAIPATGVLTSSGNIEDGLPLPLYSRLHYIITQQLKRQVYSVRPAVPVQHAQSAKIINSKSAGRLLAAGGVYNGNIDGFKKTAEQLGGDAPAGYAQVMDNKGLFITAASVVTGLTMGRMRFPELEELEQFGARGTVSGRPFDPDKAGGPIEDLTTDGVNITHEGIAIVEKHTSRFGEDPGNEFMINRLKKIADGKIPHEQVDLNYYTHECREYQRYCNLGWETGAPADNLEAHELWNNTHTATLEDYKLKGEVEDIYHPDAPLW